MQGCMESPYDFWLWEYQRRNSIYKEKFELFNKELSKLENRIGICFWPCRWTPKIINRKIKPYNDIIEELVMSFINNLERGPSDYRNGLDSKK